MRKLYFILLFVSTATFAQITVSTITPSFNGSGAVTIDEAGNIYIGDFGDFLGGPDTDGIPNNVMKLDTNLNLTVFANDFTGASGNEFDSNGILYQADIRDNAVYKIVNGSRELYTSQGLFSPVGIAFDSNDNLYVCNCGVSNIRKITPDGTSTLFSTGNGLLACPNGMTIDENGNLYVVNFSNTNIVKIQPDGTATNIGNTVGGNGHIDYDVNTNNLYIASFGTNLIYYLDLDNLTSGTSIIAGTVVAGTGMGVAGNDDGSALSSTFSAPNGIAVSKTGDSLYINSSATLNNNNLNPQYVRLLTNVLSTLSLNDYEAATNELKIYPNPVKDTFMIESNFANTNDLSIKIWDMNGKNIEFNATSEASKLKVDVSKLKSGMYFYCIKAKTRKIKIGKLIKE
ncbi:hypothetical protein FBALC1_04002 [Flavobacteriales bacterium ALC-1]|nr:hypothetical protein FBALC1_04002 [Flavobacteriales bacterium ALC-1]